MSTPPAVTIVDGDSLPAIETPVSGLRAHRALATEGATLLRVAVAGAGEPASDWMRHPDRGAYGVVRAGRLGVTYRRADGSDETLEATPGDCFRIPAGVEYRLTAIDGRKGKEEEGKEDGVEDGEEVVVLLALVGSGPLFEAVDEPTSADEKTSTADRTSAADPPRVAVRSSFTPTAHLSNLTRLMPFPDAPVQQVTGHASRQISSEWHHHGDNDVFGYVISGAGYVDDGSDTDDQELATAGSFFHIPAGLIHRDVNPSDEEQDYVLWLTGSEPRIVYVSGPGSSA